MNINYHPKPKKDQGADILLERREQILSFLRDNSGKVEEETMHELIGELAEIETAMNIEGALAYNCRLHEIKMNAMSKPVSPPCPTCGGVGSHVRGCKVLLGKIKSQTPKGPNLIQLLFGDKP